MTESAQENGPVRQGGWHVERAGDVLVLARRWPARFDLAVGTVFTGVGQGGSRARLAHQLRQDAWRCLRHLRGFWPAVRIVRRADDLLVTVGGGLDHKGAARAGQAEALLSQLLDDPVQRARWLRHAGMRGVTRADGAAA